MTEVKTFQELEILVSQSRGFFRKNLGEAQPEIEQIIELCFKILRSISKFYSSEKWENSQQEYALSVLIQSLETTLSMYYLSESGYWDLSLTFKRNIAELFSVAIAIGYDTQCYIDWKNERDNINDFGKIIKRIDQSREIPDIDKGFIPMLKKYWNESSQIYSHNVGKKSIRTLVKSGQIKFEPKIAPADFQQERLRTIRNILLNILSLISGIFNYGEVTKNRKQEFPEALGLIAEANSYFTNANWKLQKTS